MSRTAQYIAWTHELTSQDTSLFGLKSEEVARLLEADLAVPKGFAVSSHAYAEFVSENNFSSKVRHLLSSADYSNPTSIKQVSAHIKNLFKTGSVSSNVVNEIVSAYKKLGSFLDDAFVTVSASPTHHNSFFDNDYSQVKGDATLIETIKDKWSVIFSPMAIFKLRENLLNKSPGVSIMVQKVYHGAQIGSLNTESFDVSSDGAIPQDLKLELKGLGDKINKHYYFPQIVNWVFANGSVYITSVKPITHQMPQSASSPSVAAGAGRRIVSGVVLIVKSKKDLNKINKDSVVIVNKITKDILPEISIAKALVAEDRISNSLSKDIKIPSVFGVLNAAKSFKNGDVVTVNVLRGQVYKGSTYDSINRINISSSSGKTATKLFVNLSHAGELNDLSTEKIDGIIFSPDEIIRSIGVHPKKLIVEKREDLLSSAIEKEFSNICQKVKDKFIFFKLSSFTSFDYKSFDGGEEFETPDLNPYIGFRGAIRHIYQTETLELEIRSIKNLAVKGDNYIGIIIPFLRSASELTQIVSILNSNGLKRSTKFRIWMVVQTPANALMLDQYLTTGIDGILLDPSTLYSLLNGVDKNSFELSNHYKNLVESLNIIISKAIEISQKNNIFSSIDQTYGVNPELLRLSVKRGVNSVTVSSGEVEYTKRFLVQTERELLRRP